MGFKPVAKKARVADSPVDFFQDLRPRKIAALYDQQAQLLRDYASKAVDKPDVAIQGATGSGKTLVGLVMAEWRRRKFQERPVYLCPTRQLVHQVANFAQDQLGLPAFAFVGSKHSFPPKEKSGWLSGDVLAVSTYSAVFNINPFFSSPNFIVVDDAHAADQYIGEYWTVRVSKRDVAQRSLFDALAAVLAQLIPGDEYARLAEDPRSLSDNLWVQMVPTPLVVALEPEITSILDQVEDGTDLDFRWQVLKGHLKATQLFISPNEIMFRPVVPPTGTHAPFNGAKQRLYMSATLGRGGEIERLSGRKSITRLPSPTGWDGHSVGRRFFMFPNASLTEGETDSFVMELIKQTEPQRALVLAADDRSAGQLKDTIGSELPDFTVYSAHEIETSKATFVGDEKAIAVIANRYDGIDFPDDECRLLLVGGKPSGMILLERYLTEKLGARALFAERIRTRIIQAFGRCTRSAKDYAIVCVAGHGLMDDLLRNEWQTGLDRELQAELKFGEAQSRNQSKEDLLDLAELFLDQGDDWRNAEDEILTLKDDLSEATPSGMKELAASAKHEIDYVDALWSENYEKALEAAQEVIDALSGGSDLKGYRGMWHYLAGCAAFLLADEEGKDKTKADEYFRKARSIAGVRVQPIGINTVADHDEAHAAAAQQDLTAIQGLEINLTELGLTNQRNFSALEKEIREGLMQDEASKFEAAHEKLGDILGFNAQNSEEKGAPDPRWLISDKLCIVFEDHVKKTNGDELSLEKARQAASHPKWVKTNIKILSDDAEIIPVIVTNADASSVDCQTHLNGVAVWPLDEFRDWAKDVLKTIRGLRAKLSGLGDLAWRAEAIAALEGISATPSSLRRALAEMTVKEDG